MTSFTTTLARALRAATVVEIDGMRVDRIEQFPASVCLSSRNYMWRIEQQNIQISEEGLALVPDLRGDIHELEFCMQRPMTEADLV